MHKSNCTLFISGMTRFAVMTVVLASLAYFAADAQHLNTASGPENSGAGQLRILSSDASGITIEYRPVIIPKSIDGTRVVYDFDDAVQRTAEFIAAPDLRFRKELLALPSVDGNRVSVLQADYRDERGIRVAPLPEPRKGEKGIEFRYKEGAAYGSQSFIPEQVGRLEHIGVARDRVLGNLVIYPVQWNPATGNARIYSRIVLRIDYGSPTRSFETVAVAGKNTVNVLNQQQANSWVLKRRPSIRKTADADLETGSWYRITTGKTGIYVLDRTWLADAGIDVDAIDPRTIRIYGSGGRELPADLDAERPEDLQEIAIEVIGENDGSFGASDEVRFFARSLNNFSYNSGSKQYEHYIHRFDDSNAWLLTFGGKQGKRMQHLPSSSEPSAYQPDWFEGHEAVEEEVNTLMSSGKLWVAHRLLPGAGSAATAVYSRKLNGLVKSQPVRYRVQLYSSSETSNWFIVDANGTELGKIQMPTVDYGTEVGDVAKSSGARSYETDGNLTDSRSTVRATYHAMNNDNARGGYVDWIEWHYSRRFEAVDNRLLFSAPDTQAVIQFELNGFSMSDVHVFEVTDHSEVRLVTGFTPSGGTVRFQAPTEDGRPSQFFAVTPSAMYQPGPAVYVGNSDLLASEGAGFLIITASDFVDAAGRLRAHRERAGEDYISTKVVSLNHIYNEFNGSVTDPTAIRNFLSFAYENWNIPPRYVLLLGDGHFDYMNYASEERSIVPVWETENSTSLIGSYVTDDYYAMIVGFGAINDRRVDLAMGRIPVQTPQEALSVIDKIIRYESSPDLDPWRNRVVFVADDGLTSSGDDGRTHTSQSEEIAKRIPAELEQKKIYIISYRTENTAQGRRKPDANQAIIDQFNQGAVVMNYTGHGAHDVWAHERIFLSDVTIPQLVNQGRPTFIAAATCTFGLYDRPGVRSGTELLILKREGGAIGGLSAPRVVYSIENSAFNREYFEHLLNEGRELDGRAKRLGEASWATKQMYNSTPGYEKFHLFADPTLRLALPRYRAVIESISINGVPATTDTVQLKAFSKVSFDGSIRRSDGSVWTDFNGLTEVSLFDAERNSFIEEWNWSYLMPGGLLYRGQASIVAGRFSVKFIIPKDISYENKSGRFSIYFDDDLVDGAGHTTKIIIGGTDTTGAADNDGPEIQLFMDSRKFHPGDVVNENSNLIVDLFDENGINTTGLGIGHDIEAWLDDSQKSYVLNEFYKGDVDSYQQGTVEFMIRNLSSGNHTLKLRAYDTYNNSSNGDTYFVVANSAQLSIEHVLNYPNPMAEETAFTFQHNLLDPVNVDIKLYTLTGRQVKNIEQRNISDRFVQIHWDGRDEDGDKMANGVYFYKVICRSIDGSKGSEALGKLTILR